MDKCTLAALSTARGMARGHWEHPDQRGEDTRETHPTQSHHSAALIFSVIWALLTPRCHRTQSCGRASMLLWDSGESPCLSTHNVLFPRVEAHLR